MRWTKIAHRGADRDPKVAALSNDHPLPPGGEVALSHPGGFETVLGTGRHAQDSLQSGDFSLQLTILLHGNGVKGVDPRQIAPGLATPEERAALPPQCWRMVWRNPVNGRGAIYLASHAYGVDGMEPAAGKRLIDELMRLATAPGASYLHPWRKGDVVMWDNRATMHRGRPWPAHEARLMVRTTISATEADGVGTMRSPSSQAAE